MKKSDFYYDLPRELIAQTPVYPRDSSRLMVIDRASGDTQLDRFYNIADFLKKGDLLVMNDSKVFPARLLGEKISTKVLVEFLLLEQKSSTVWETIVHPGRRLPVGAEVAFGEELTAKVIERLDSGNRLVEFDYEGDFFEILERVGKMPLPHYITEELKDNDRYNTIYSSEIGSAAAPTAGLHFTDKVFDSLTEKRIDTAKITLHVGLGTFRPVKSENIKEHKMHKEHFTIPEKTAEKINRCKRNGGRIIAVGTTSCRTLESVANANNGEIIATSASTDIFIYPGYKFKVIDGIITNFHLPESTLIMLVSAFLGREKTLNAYHKAIEEKMRFFSFGDSTLIV